MLFNIMHVCQFTEMLCQNDELSFVIFDWLPGFKSIKLLGALVITRRADR